MFSWGSRARANDKNPQNTFVPLGLSGGYPPLVSLTIFSPLDSSSARFVGDPGSRLAVEEKSKGKKEKIHERPGESPRGKTPGLWVTTMVDRVPPLGFQEATIVVGTHRELSPHGLSWGSSPLGSPWVLRQLFSFIIFDWENSCHRRQPHGEPQEREP